MLNGLGDRSRRNDVRIDGIVEEAGETWEECERKVQCLLSEELDLNNVVTERTHRVKAYSPSKKNSKKLKPRTVVCKLLSFVDQARTTCYVNKYFSKETLAYGKE